MMQTFTDLAERTHLLWLQRLSLSSSDYISLSQLKQHDYRLLQSVRLCQRYLGQDNAELPCWLSAVLDNSVAAIDKLLALPLALPAQVLLAELWLALQHKTAAHYLEQYNRTEQSQLVCLLAGKPAAAGLYPAMKRLDLRSAIQLAGRCGLTAECTDLQQLATERALDAAALAELNYNLYLLGQTADELNLVQQLQRADCLTPRQLQFLLLAASAEQKVQIVNALCLTDSSLAINAMGFSGQSKFLPLLLELSKQPAHQAAAQSALITMLGTTVPGNITAETLQRELQAETAPALISNQSLIAGKPVAQLDLAALWANGNQYHRFAAAALRVLRQPGLALAEPNNWQGGVWPVA